LKSKTETSRGEVAAAPSISPYDHPIRSRIWKLGAAAAVLLAILLPHFLELPKPYVITFISLAVCFITIAFAIVRRPAMQNVCVLLASVSLCLAVGELGAWFLNTLRPQMTINTLEFNYEDPDLGYSPEPSQRAHVREVYGRTVLFDVTYTIDTNGFRVIPVAAPLAQCLVAFFGDSFTFGWGLSDTETMPNKFVAASGGIYRGYNFAQNGYGAHQMLRMLETGRFDRVVGDGPTNLVIYQAIVEHVARVVGRNTWDPRGPQYLITADNQRVAYVGPFHSNAYVVLLEWLERSDIYSYVTSKFFYEQARVQDVPLYVAILKQVKREVEQRYGAGTFVIVMWYDSEVLDADPTEQFKEAGLNVIPIDHVIPDITENRASYVLADQDWHPNAVANQRIAEFLAREVGPQHCNKNAAAITSP
jgi:hypothetical protein